MGSSSPWGLALILHFIPVVVFALDFDNLVSLHYGVGFRASHPAPATSSGTFEVALAQSWTCSTWTSSASKDPEGSGPPPLERPRPPSSHWESNAVVNSSLALLALQAIEKASCLSLPDLSAPLADCHRSYLCPWSQAVPERPRLPSLGLSWWPSVLPGRSVTSRAEITSKGPESKRRERKGCARFWAFSTFSYCALSASDFSTWCPLAASCGTSSPLDSAHFTFKCDAGGLCSLHSFHRSIPRHSLSSPWPCLRRP
jgi:hypothetical protein